MFELSVALKYLIPRRRQLSVSIISLISTFVIALVVWLIVVFFSVTSGLEKNWTEKLTSLTAPVRVLPKDTYYQSYYYQVDGISAASGYNYKSFFEKLRSDSSNPYDPGTDQEIPSHWIPPATTENGEVVDLVKTVFQDVDSLKGIPGLRASPYEVGMASLKLNLVRQPKKNGDEAGGSLTQAAYFGSFEGKNPSLEKTTVPLMPDDVQNLLDQGFLESTPYITIHELRTPAQGWVLPPGLLPKETELRGVALYNGLGAKTPTRIILPFSEKEIPEIVKATEKQGWKVKEGSLKNLENNTSFEGEITSAPLILGAHYPLKVESKGQLYHVSFYVQGKKLEGDVPLRSLKVHKVSLQTEFMEEPKITPAWLYKVKDEYRLPEHPKAGPGILLPKSFQRAGVLVGDKGYFTYPSPTPSSVQELRSPLYVAGFYDPGIIPIGGKFVLVNPDVVMLLKGSGQEGARESHGINVRFNNIGDAKQVKNKLEALFKEQGLDAYWDVETYEEYEFTKDIIHQLHSEKNLFKIIAAIIIIVACSNIVSMLIILVKDKRKEIGILRSLGASSKSIAIIFGLCGIVMGTVGSALGILAGWLTLSHIDLLFNMLTTLQGYDAFNEIFYGDVMPNEVSMEALIFVLCTTLATSLIAGIVPAVKACRINVSKTLRAD